MATKNTSSPADADFEKLLRELQTTAGQLRVTAPPTNTRATRSAHKRIREVIDQLAVLSASVDSVRRPAAFFDPTDPKTAAAVVALALVAQKRQRLDAVAEHPFYGSGVYSIYYQGPFPPYAAISSSEHPIYVGVATPKDGTARDAVAQGTALWDRMNEHVKNIGLATSTLKTSDFDCRFLVVQTGFQDSAEERLINFFRPIWNKETKVCHGIGKHGDAATTRVNKRSPWDTLHPGRPWAGATAEDQRPKRQIISDIDKHFRENPPHKSIEDIVESLLSSTRQ